MIVFSFSENWLKSMSRSAKYGSFRISSATAILAGAVLSKTRFDVHQQVTYLLGEGEEGSWIWLSGDGYNLGMSELGLWSGVKLKQRTALKDAL